MSFVCTGRENRNLLAAIAKLNSATAEKQCNQENQAAGIHTETKALHLATAAAQEQDDKQNPSAVASAHESATAATAAAVVFVTATVAFVEHSVEHIYLHFAEVIGFSIRLCHRTSAVVIVYFTIWKF